jgi:hypothetical protein
MTIASAPSPINWDTFARSLGDLEVVRDPSQLEKLSKDYYHFSPVLQGQLTGYVADLVVRPENGSRGDPGGPALRGGSGAADGARGRYG